jgi:hypothetical protein
MTLLFNELEIQTSVPNPPLSVVPLAAEADFDNRNQFLAVYLYSFADSDSYAYQNAESCPDCSAGMIRQGRCCACPSCGFESCMV